ncbi:MAG: hypothetical protein QOH81_844 [Sphingomonadales bacterium]|jgi:hypothetical protein|nr:hypothetical protein [Sphingomonadales bacterium]
MLANDEHPIFLIELTIRKMEIGPRKQGARSGSLYCGRGGICTSASKQRQRDQEGAANAPFKANAS